MQITHHKALKKMLSKITSKQYSTIIFIALIHICSSFDTLDETKNITGGQTLVSSSRIFELGFFKPGMSTNWFVGIWYVVSPETVVWVANRDRPMNHSSSTLRVSKGAIVLIDPSQEIIWSSSVYSYIGNISNCTMRLLDSGNLIIKDTNGGNIIWQSFDYPSNTLLPGMKIGKKLATGFEWFLSSWKSEMDPSKGNYYYKMDTLGVPQNILWNNAQIEFRTGPWDGMRFSGVPEMKTYENMFSFKLVSDLNEVYYTFETKQGGPLSRLVLNETGVVQRLVWDETSHTWRKFWYGPKDPCDYYGKCGPFGICNINEVTICGGLDGFYPKSPKEWFMRNFSGGYERKTQLSCHDKDNGFYMVKGVKVPDTHSATTDASVSIEECKNKCLMNCSCLAYSVLDIRYGSGCITWSNDLLDIRYIPGAQDLYIKTAKTYLAKTGNNRRQDVRIGIIVTGTIIPLLVILLTGITYWTKVLRAYTLAKVRRGSLKDTDLPLFDLATVAASTGNFSPANELGQGGFGVVYKKLVVVAISETNFELLNRKMQLALVLAVGKLPSGEEIAVKRLSRESSQGLNEFMNEVMLIAKLQHRNLVRMIGCCIQGSERMLIYEYMTNKSLDWFIFDEQRRTLLNWRSRLEVIIGIARGLLYLHHDSRFNIIHRDLKAANILLDEEMTPKISDFGTARLFRQDENEIATEIIVGTRGYMSPEYAMEGKMSVKSDVYSFGVLLLEIISGKRNYGNQNVLAYAWNLWKEGRVIHLVDETITDSSSVQSELLRCIHVGLLCVQECADDRPTMSEIVLMLSSNSSILPEPNKPGVCTRTTPQLALPEHLFDSTNDLTVTDIEGR